MDREAGRKSGCRMTLAALVGLEGFEVKRVAEVGDRLDLEVDWSRAAVVAPDCGRASLDVSSRVRVRDLPLAGREPRGRVAPYLALCRE
jgi:hypothetical protein